MLQRICMPAPGLRQFVRFYTQRQMRIEGPVFVHPITARTVAMIEFELIDPVNALHIEGGFLEQSPPVTLVGPQTHHRVDLQLQGALEHFVIMFQPDGLSRLFSIPMHALTDGYFEGHAVLGAFISHAYQRLGECASFEERVSFVDGLLFTFAQAARGYDGISAAANRILLGGGRVAITCAGRQRRIEHAPVRAKVHATGGYATQAVRTHREI